MTSVLWGPQRDAVRAALNAAGLTHQGEVAEKLGTSQAHISCVLSGKRPGSLDLWVRLAGLVGMTWQLAPATEADAVITWLRDELDLTVQPWQADRMRAYFADEESR